MTQSLPSIRTFPQPAPRSSNDAAEVRVAGDLGVVKLVSSTARRSLQAIQRAKGNGVTAEAVVEVLVHAVCHAGRPKGWSAFRMAGQAILLIAGDKAGDWIRWYEKNIPLADGPFDDHLRRRRTRNRLRDG